MVINHTNVVARNKIVHIIFHIKVVLILGQFYIIKINVGLNENSIIIFCSFLAIVLVLDDVLSIKMGKKGD